MRQITAIALLMIIAMPLQANAKTKATPEKTAQTCRQAATEAERRHSIPAGLLAAIALVETGRKISSDSARTAWPWAIHSQGKGHWLDSREAAIKKVEALKAKGVKNIDVGCMQINLMHHPKAFPDLHAAFTPRMNTDYAARFLVKLFKETRSWSRAAAYYHSRTPARAKAYKKKVLAAWNGQAVSQRKLVRNQVRAKTGRNVAASRHLRVRGSTAYVQSGRNAIRIRRY